MESIREILAREAAEAESIAEEEENAKRPPQPGRRGRRQAADPSQVYSVRVPVERLEQLRKLAAERGVAPTALLRQFVVERLDQESMIKVVTQIERDPQELRLGPSRRAPLAPVRPLQVKDSRPGPSRKQSMSRDDEHRQERRV